MSNKVVTTITIPDTVLEIGNGVFRGTSISSIKFPKNLKKLGESAFYECTNLTSVTIPDSITRIETSTFAICSSLKEVVIPDSVTWIGNGAFSNCSELASVKLPSHPITYNTDDFSAYGAFGVCPKLSLATRKAIQESGYEGDF